MASVQSSELADEIADRLVELAGMEYGCPHTAEDSDEVCWRCYRRQIIIVVESVLIKYSK